VKLYLEPNPQGGTDNELWPTTGGIFTNFQNARGHLDGGLKYVPVGYPLLSWEGTPEYTSVLGRNVSKAVTRELTPHQALDEASEEWLKIVRSWASTGRRPRTQISSMAHGGSVTRSDAGTALERAGGGPAFPAVLRSCARGFTTAALRGED
jgi:hypothetical protein